MPPSVSIQLYCCRRDSLFFTVSFSKERKKDITIFFCVILQITVVFYNFCNYTSPLCITFTAKNISYRLGFFLVPARYSQV